MRGATITRTCDMFLWSMYVCPRPTGALMVTYDPMEDGSMAGPLRPGAAHQRTRAFSVVPCKLRRHTHPASIPFMAALIGTRVRACSLQTSARARGARSPEPYSGDSGGSTPPRRDARIRPLLAHDRGDADPGATIEDDARARSIEPSCGDATDGYGSAAWSRPVSTSRGAHRPCEYTVSL
jgi:hypothetical protein